MYWLSADPAERFACEIWKDYVHRSCTEVAEGFGRLVGTTDFESIVRELPSDLRDKVMATGIDFARALVFVAYLLQNRSLMPLRGQRDSQRNLDANRRDTTDGLAVSTQSVQPVSCLSRRPTVVLPIRVMVGPCRLRTSGTDGNRNIEGTRRDEHQAFLWGNVSSGKKRPVLAAERTGREIWLPSGRRAKAAAAGKNARPHQASWRVSTRHV